MKKVFLVSCLLFSVLMISAFTTVKAAESNEVIYEESSFELTYKSKDKLKTVEIDKETAEKLVELNKNLKKDKKAKLLEESQDLLILTSYIGDLSELGNGGSGSAYSNTVESDCKSISYDFCIAVADYQDEYEITELVVKISLDPHESTGAYLRSTLTWHTAPVYSYTDFMSLGYLDDVLTTDDNTIKASYRVEFDYTHWEGIDIFNKTSGSDVYENVLEYADNKDIIEQRPGGLLWTIENVYHSYVNHPDITMPRELIPVCNGCTETYKVVDVNKITYNFETRLSLRTVVNGPQKYRDVSPLKFSADYIHVYPKVSATPNIVLRAVVGSSPSISLSVIPTITLSGDETRLCEITMLFQ